MKTNNKNNKFSLSATELRKLIQNRIEGSTYSISNLMDVIMSFENPNRISELITGIYEPPVFAPTCKNTHLQGRRDEEREFMAHNPITGKVQYFYQSKRNTYCWVPKGIEYPTCEDIVCESSELDDYCSEKNWDKKTFKKEFTERHMWTGKYTQDTSWIDEDYWDILEPEDMSTTCDELMC
jgi:hypothetical protein